jgi:hypothetical protein
LVVIYIYIYIYIYIKSRRQEDGWDVEVVVHKNKNILKKNSRRQEDGWDVELRKEQETLGCLISGINFCQL